VTLALLTVAYLACFNAAAIPAIVRIVRRKSSQDLSLWREWFVLTGIAIQFAAFWLAGAGWIVLISPMASALSMSALLTVTYWFRRGPIDPATVTLKNGETLTLTFKRSDVDVSL
jgi:hypothetical protein